jgi:hypothetical protein
MVAVWCFWISLPFAVATVPKLPQESTEQAVVLTMQIPLKQAPSQTFAASHCLHVSGTKTQKAKGIPDNAEIFTQA